MTLSQIIKLRTNNGRDVIDFLVDVMQDRYSDFRMCHRLRAARLLTTYGNEDAPGFIADNTSDTPARRKRSKAPRKSKFDTELARVIREDTDDGRSIARFLVNVMEGEWQAFKPHHRIAAARELLDRGFGKSAPTEPPIPNSTFNIHNSTPTHQTIHPDPAEGPTHTEPTEEAPLVHPEPAEGPNPQIHNSTFTIPNLETDLIDILTHTTPNHFEHTVLDLLNKMGYGHARHTGRSGDGGIDGIIEHDDLGLYSVYVQAKRWTRQVGEPEVRSFSGSLDPRGATKGILITTSDFSESARCTAESISAGNKHIRLIDGRELAQLMIRHSVGVTTETPHHAPKNVTPYSDTGLDENYFNQYT